MVFRPTSLRNQLSGLLIKFSAGVPASAMRKKREGFEGNGKMSEHLSQKKQKRQTEECLSHITLWRGRRASRRACKWEIRV